MNRNYLIGALLLVVIIAVGLGVALYTGAGPAPGGGGSGDDLADFPTETVSDGETRDLTESDTLPFSFTIDDVESCGLTCRDVTATVRNNQNDEASGITVYSRVFAGKNTTETDDLVWEGQEAVGSLAAGSAYTSTTRVELSFQEAQKIDNSDGWITIQTTVESDRTTMTFQNSEQVN